MTAREIEAETTGPPDLTRAEQAGEPRTRVVPARRARKAGSARGLFTVPDDFAAPPEDFRDYM